MGVGFAIWMLTVATNNYHAEQFRKESFGTLEQAQCFANNVFLAHSNLTVEWQMTTTDTLIGIANSTYSYTIFKPGDTYDCWITRCFWNPKLEQCTNTYAGFDAYHVYQNVQYTPIHGWDMFWLVLYFISGILNVLSALHNLWKMMKIMRENW